VNWQTLKGSGLLHSVYPDPVEHDHHCALWDMMQGESPVNTWDYQWHFTCIANGGLTIIPNRNLVTNIGFDEAGVHCSGKTPDPGLGEGFSELIHPQFILPNSAADRYQFDTLFGGNSIRQQRHFTSRLRNRFRSWRTRWLSSLSLKII
jgi:hypothetical protein